MDESGTGYRSRGSLGFIHVLLRSIHEVAELEFNFAARVLLYVRVGIKLTYHSVELGAGGFGVYYFELGR